MSIAEVRPVSPSYTARGGWDARGKHPKISIAMPAATFAAIRELAQRNHTSFARQARRLIDIGIEAQRVSGGSDLSRLLALPARERRKIVELLEAS